MSLAVLRPPCRGHKGRATARRLSRSILPVVLLLAGAARAAAPSDSPAFTVTSTSKYVDVLDVPSLTKPFVTPRGFADKAYYAEAARPSKTYQEFFGVQALADTTRSGILRDFVPAHATLVGEDRHSLTLRFKEGYTMRFLPGSAVKLAAQNVTVPLDHAYVSGATWREQQRNLGQFRSLLKKAGLEGRYLVRNPMYDA